MCPYASGCCRCRTACVTPAPSIIDHRTAQGVRRILVRALASFYCRDAKTRGIENAKAGAIVSVQRFDSALRLNLQGHYLALPTP
jgi:hypothetical protein